MDELYMEANNNDIDSDYWYEESLRQAQDEYYERISIMEELNND